MSFVKLAVAILAIGFAFTLHGKSADLGTMPPAASAPVETVDSYLDRKAVLLMIRTTFDVIEADALPQLLKTAAGNLDAAGADADQTAVLDRELLAEGSYYLVSLRYTALSGGAIWPADRPEDAYVKETVGRLDALQAALIDAVAHRDDPLPIFEEAQRIMLLTYGELSVPKDRDRFAGRDALVDAALAANGPHADT